MKKQIKSIISLFVICAVIAVTLAFTNILTLPSIEANEEKATQDALLEVMPEGKAFKKLEEFSGLPENILEVYEEECGGFVFKVKSSGYSSNMIILCGIKGDGSISGAKCLSSGETLGYEKTYGESFKGYNRENLNVDTIAGATKTTGGYKKAVSDALDAFNSLGGGDK